MNANPRPSPMTDYDRLDNCGKQECEREARDAMQGEREEAHERLDRDNGWN